LDDLKYGIIASMYHVLCNYDEEKDNQGTKREGCEGCGVTEELSLTQSNHFYIYISSHLINLTTLVLVGSYKNLHNSTMRFDFQTTVVAFVDLIERFHSDTSKHVHPRTL
jgi:uncharacterized protein affecting Mg2+/Co2+ transport